MNHKRVPNRDILPQYYIKDHHPAIISEEEFQAVQQEIKRRYNMRKDPDGKYRMNYSGKAPFSNKLFCGHCGRPVVRRRLTSQTNGEKYLFSAWQCRVPVGRDPDFKGCNGRYVWEVDLEDCFTELLREMRNNRDEVIADAEQAIADKRLSEKEQARFEELEKQLEAVTNRISDLASREMGSADALYDATLRHLIFEQEILKQEYDALKDKKEGSLYFQKHLEVLLEYLDQLPKRFSDEIFIKTVERGILDRDKKVTFEFKCGIVRKKPVGR
ncbi:recombinase zinc beta ribbon domain-containing protein [Heliorestis convoluta]|uniref:recombinase zinc beta ribbon domain-containing protein n=1 Tax=Heliorestis convoluta TaxID=356322 RepID=UPI0034A4C942